MYKVILSGTVYSKEIKWQYSDYGEALDKYIKEAGEQGDFLSIVTGKENSKLQLITPDGEGNRTLKFASC